MFPLWNDSLCIVRKVNGVPARSAANGVATALSGGTTTAFVSWMATNPKDLFQHESGPLGSWSRRSRAPACGSTRQINSTLRTVLSYLAFS